jgi:hypothetical protein
MPAKIISKSMSHVGQDAPITQTKTEITNIKKKFMSDSCMRLHTVCTAFVRIVGSFQTFLCIVGVKLLANRRTYMAQPDMNQAGWPRGLTSSNF